MEHTYYHFLDELRRNVEDYFHIADLKKRTRAVRHVHARMVFTKIALDKGYLKTQIADYLRRDKNVIAYYAQHFNVTEFKAEKFPDCHFPLYESYKAFIAS